MTVEQITSDNAQEIRAQTAVHIEKIEEIILPLKPGERLTRDEFERRYDAMPYIKKAELIKGVVYMPPPVRHKRHSRPHGYIMGWLANYCAATPGVDFGDNPTVRLEGDNEPQPDALLRIDEAHGGNSRIDEDDYIKGGPEFIVEVAGASADFDLNEKLEIYRRHGVKEYVVWRTEEEQLDWFQLIEGEYVRLMPDADGIIASQIFPGLRLAVGALLEGDLASVLSELQRGLSSVEHAAFVERLSEMV